MNAVRDLRVCLVTAHASGDRDRTDHDHED
jgi:hypothetical protein